MSKKVNEKGLASGKRCQAFFTAIMKQKIFRRAIALADKPLIRKMAGKIIAVRLLDDVSE